MATTSEPHRHKYVALQPKKVLLYKSRNEEGKARNVALMGYDLLKQRKCACGKVETYDLERVRV